MTASSPPAGASLSELWAQGGLLASSCALMAIASGVWYTGSLFFVALLEEFRADHATTAGIFSLFTILYGVFGIPAGLLMDRLGPRRIILIGGLLLPLAHVGSGLATGIWWLYLTHGFLTPLALSFAGYVPVSILITRLFQAQRGLALGIASAGVGVGILAIVPMAQYAIDLFGWRVGYCAMAALAAVVIPPVALWAIPEGAKPAPAPPSPTPEPPAREAGWTLAAALRSRSFWLVGATFITLNSATQLVLTHQAAYLVEAGHSRMLVAWTIGLIGLASIPGKIGWGFLSDRRWLEWIYVWGGALVIAATVTLLTVGPATPAWMLAIYGILMGLGYAVSPALCPTISARFFAGPSFGAIFGLLNTLYQLGGAAGIWLAGYAHDLTGSYRLPFLICIVCVVCSAGFAWLAAPRHAPLPGRRGR